VGAATVDVVGGDLLSVKDHPAATGTCRTDRLLGVGAELLVDGAVAVVLAAVVAAFGWAAPAELLEALAARLAGPVAHANIVSVNRGTIHEAERPGRRLATGFPPAGPRWRSRRKEHPMAQNPRSGEQIPTGPQRPADAARPVPIIDENARRLREWGPKIQVVTRRPRDRSGS
jgi:hypothetical protein